MLEDPPAARVIDVDNRLSAKFGLLFTHSNPQQTTGVLYSALARALDTMPGHDDAGECLV